MAAEGLTLDSGALIAIERGDRRVQRIIERVLARGGEVHVVAGVVAQVWRGGARQTRLARFLSGAEVLVHSLDEATAEQVGELCGVSGHADVIDVHVALHARSMRHAVLTSDPDDLRRIDPRLPLIVV